MGNPFPITLWERVGVRGCGLSIEHNPSPGSHLSMRSDLSHKGRGNALSRVRRFNFFKQRCLQPRLHDLAALIARGVREASAPKRSRAQGMPGAQCTRSLACDENKHTSVVTTVTPESSRHSPRNGFTAYAVLSPATNSCCHRHRRIKGSIKPG